MISRRRFIERLGCSVGGMVMMHRAGQDTAQVKPKPARRGAADTLETGDITGAAVGPVEAVAPVDPMDNDPVVIGVERKLRCRCGCTLDVYTCRTTDFSCTVSPAMHHDVVALIQGGAKPDEVVQAFATRYGEAVLMSPPPHGLNLAGYLVPGFSVLAVGIALVAWLTRRGGGAIAASPPPRASLDDEQRARLRRALDDVQS
ncbi:MAG: cytochrome c-type biogenesis protein [Gemmatimonadales bacterium]